MQNLDNILSLEKLDFFARRLVEGFLTGKHKSPFHGFSVEFADHRAYNSGESTKNVDWKLYARTDKLFVKRFEEETNLRCRIILDVSSSMFYPFFDRGSSIDNPNKILYSVYSAASLMKLFKNQRDAVGLSLYSDDLHFHSSCKTTQKHHLVLQNKMIEIIDKSNNLNFKKTSTVNSIHSIASQLKKRSLVLLFTDMFDSDNNIDDIFLSLQHLKFQKHEVIIFHLYDSKTEYDLNFPNTPHKFIDIETNEKIKLNPMDLRKIYKEKSSNFKNHIKLKCLEHKIDLVNVDINQGIEQILSAYLLKRKKMF